MEIAEYDLVKQEVLELTNINLDHYKVPQMQRRLKTFLMRSGYSHWQDYFKVIKGDFEAVSKLRDYLTINVSSFFRDQQKYNYLKDAVLPELLYHRPRLNIWSAGCSRGQEPYSLAILLEESDGSSHNHHILASDLDHSALNWAKAGGPYSNDDVVNLDEKLRKVYFTKDAQGYWANESLKKRINFHQHNLVTDRFEEDFDLIICRNVVIYFTSDVKEQLYSRFYKALRPGGILFVGGTEIVPNATKIGFMPAGISFYRRSH
jgi:chemotaxis protein methyltransferase CheR